MSEEKPSWVYTQFVKATRMDDDKWPSQDLTASINPVLDFIEVSVSHRHSGMMIRMPKSEFEDWLKRCQEEIANPSYPAPNPVDSK